MGIRQLENYELKKLFNKQGTQLDQINDLIAVALGNTEGRFEMLINPARGGFSKRQRESRTRVCRCGAINRRLHGNEKRFEAVIGFWIKFEPIF